MERELCNGSAGTFFQIINIGNDIDLNIFMSHLMNYVLNKYPNVSNFFYLSIIILTVVLIVTVIQSIICVESTCVFQYT